MEALTAEGGHEDPDMRALIARASGGAANSMRMPWPAGRGRRGLWGWGAADTLRLSAPRTAPLGRGKQEGPVCGTGRV
jgi:hypothetical protein